MASNVFGTPITDEYLKRVRGNVNLSQIERARMALEMKNAEGKDVNARAYIDKVMQEFGDSYATTRCLIYNATGDSVTFVADHSWVGRFCEPLPPFVIENGQWAAFLHGQYIGQEGTSKAAFVYSGNNSAGENRNWVMCFGSFKVGNYNELHTQVCKPWEYKLDSGTSADWESLENQMTHKNETLVHQAKENGGLLFGAIGNTAYVVFEGILTLPQAI